MMNIELTWEELFPVLFDQFKCGKINVATLAPGSSAYNRILGSNPKWNSEEVMAYLFLHSFNKRLRVEGGTLTLQRKRGKTDGELFFQMIKEYDDKIGELSPAEKQLILAYRHSGL